MLEANNNDILFDDLGIIGSTHHSDSPAENAILYGDCSNRYEVINGESSNPDGNCSSYKEV